MAGLIDIAGEESEVLDEKKKGLRMASSHEPALK